MIKLIRSNQKAVLAVLSIFAMITFVVNFGGKGRAEGTFTDHALGTISGKTVNVSELIQSKAELDAMRRYLDFRPRSEDEVTAYIAGTLLERTKPELFMLLRHEANGLGISVSEDQVMGYLVNHRNEAPLEPDSDNQTFLHDGVADLLRIVARYQALLQTLKVPQPQVDQMLAEQNETIQVDLVQLRADDFLDKVPAPTPEQVKAQFEQFADTFPRHPLPTTNPFGFGYKLPQRASFQYIRLTDEAISAAVVASKSLYDWDVQAHKYYYTNLATQFMQPAETTEGPAIPGFTPPATRPAVAMPFEKVQDQILTTLRKDAVATLKDQVESYITNTMTADWKAYANFIATNPKGTEPASSLGRPYSSLDYLVNLCGSVHDKFNVNLAADKTPDNLSAEQYSGWPGVGSPDVTQFVDKQSSDYLALLAKADRTAAAVLIQPSPPLQGPLESTQVFVRLTGAAAAQPPADVSLVRAQVESDLRLASAYKLAQAQAAALLISAADNNLQAAAKTVGHPVLAGDPAPSISAFSANLKGLAPPLGDDTAEFLKQGFSLLTQYQPVKNPHPARTIELPSSKRVFVIQLKTLVASWTDSTYFKTWAQSRFQAGYEAEQSFIVNWFNPEKTEERMAYKPQKAS
jgi:hypothetical protein